MKSRTQGQGAKSFYWWATSVGLTFLVCVWSAWLFEREFGAYRDQGPFLVFSESIYAALRLFVLEGPSGLAEATWTWWLLPLHISRFLAPFVLAIGGGAVGWRYLQASRERWKISKLGDHIIICSQSTEESDPAHRLALQYVARREAGSVLCVVRDEESDGAHRLHEKGALILTGEATRPETLKDGRASEASRVIIDLGDDAENARAVRALARVLEARTREEPLHCHVASSGGRVEDEWDRGIIGRAGGKLVLHPFSVPRAAARRLFELHPPWESRLPQTPQDRPLHVLILGFGPQAQAIVLQTVRSCHFADLQDVRITVVAPDVPGASVDEGWCRTHMPAWELVADIRFIQKEPTTLSEHEWALCQNERGDFDHIYVAVEDMGQGSGNGLGMASKLSGRIGTEPCTVVVYEEGTSERGVFPVWDEAVTLEAIISEQQDRMAQHIHQYYAKKYGDTRTWEVLTTDDRDSNRDQADHIWAKLGIIEAFTRSQRGHAQPDYPSASELAEAQRALSRAKYEVDGEGDGDGEESSGATPLSMLRQLSECIELKARLKKPSAGKENPDYDQDLVERLAQVEHRRWMASRICAGWVFGDPRNNRAKHHPLIVAYGALEEIEKEKDRDTARNLPALLKLALEAMSHG